MYIINIALIFSAAIIFEVLAVGPPPRRVNNIGEYGGQNLPPKPYAFNYEVTDPEGNTHFRREQSDENGVVSGSYGYTNVNGLYRTVEYIADEAGYRARVKSNEPGVGPQDPADVEMMVEPVPPGVQEMHSRAAAPSRPMMPAGRSNRPAFYPGKMG